MNGKTERRKRIAAKKLEREFAYGDWYVSQLAKGLPTLKYEQWCHPQMRKRAEVNHV